MNSKLADDLKIALGKKDLIAVKVTLGNFTYQYPAGHDEIDRAVNYAEARIKDLWQKHDERPFEPREKWDKGYLGLLHSDLMHNFSKERFEHLREVSKKLYDETHKKTAIQPKPNGGYSDTVRNGSVPGTMRKGIVVIGAAAVLLVALLYWKPKVVLLVAMAGTVAYVVVKLPVMQKKIKK